MNVHKMLQSKLKPSSVLRKPRGREPGGENAAAAQRELCSTAVPLASAVGPDAARAPPTCRTYATNARRQCPCGRSLAHASPNVGRVRPKLLAKLVPMWAAATSTQLGLSSTKVGPNQMDICQAWSKLAKVDRNLLDVGRSSSAQADRPRGRGRRTLAASGRHMVGMWSAPDRNDLGKGPITRWCAAHCIAQ